MSNTISIIFLILTCFVQTSCATSRDSILLGVGVGTTLGAGAGALGAQGRKDKDKVKIAAGTAAIGALLGGLMGYFAHKDEVEKKFLLRTEPLSDKQGTPLLHTPQVERIWVGDKIEGDRLIRGHYIYVLKRASSWRLDQK